MRRFPCQRCHGGAVPVATDVTERFQVGIGVDDKPEARDIRPDRDADVDQPTTPDQNAGVFRIDFARHAEITEQIEAQQLKLLHIRARSKSERSKREQGVARNLSREVKHDAAAATDPAYRPTPRIQFFRAWANVTATAFTSDRDAGGVIAQDQRSSGVVAADVVHEPSLVREEHIERQRSEEVRGKRLPPGVRFGSSTRFGHGTLIWW